MSYVTKYTKAAYRFVSTMGEIAAIVGLVCQECSVECRYYHTFLGLFSYERTFLPVIGGAPIGFTFDCWFCHHACMIVEETSEVII